jgi:hypothetical protein
MEASYLRGACGTDVEVLVASRRSLLTFTMDATDVWGAVAPICGGAVPFT